MNILSVPAGSAVTRASDLAAALNAQLVIRCVEKADGSGHFTPRLAAVLSPGAGADDDFPIEPLAGYIVSIREPAAWPSSSVTTGLPAGQLLLRRGVNLISLPSGTGVTRASDLATALNATMVVRSTVGPTGTARLQAYLPGFSPPGSSPDVDFPIELLRGYLVVMPAALAWPRQTQLDPAAGGTLVTTDHATVIFPPAASSPQLTASLEETTAPTASELGHEAPASRTYHLHVAGTQPLKCQFIVTLPAARALLPPGSNVSELQPEYWNVATGRWARTSGLVVQDPATGTLSILDSVDRTRASTTAARAARAKGAGTRPGMNDDDRSFDRQYRIARRYGMESYQKLGSIFVIQYYSPHEISDDPSVPADADWRGTTTVVTVPGTPAFVQHLGAALDAAYRRLLNLKDASGTALFDSLPDPQYVTVGDCGDDAGGSKLGGPIMISNAKMDNWDYMRGTAAHELVHVFQGQYYIGGRLGNAIDIFSGNNWFIEATANYYAFVATLMYSNDKLANRWVMEAMDEYLSVSLTSNDNSSKYSAADFPHYADLVGGGTGVADALVNRKNSRSRKDLENLDAALRDKGTSLSDAFFGYTQGVFKYPQKTEALYGAIKARLQSKTAAFLSGGPVIRELGRVSLSKSMPPLSVVYVSLRASASRPGCLVRVPCGSQLPAMTVRNVLHSGRGNRDAEYVDRGVEIGFAGTVAGWSSCGGGGRTTDVEELIVNSDMSAVADVCVDYTLLPPPDVAVHGETQPVTVTWTCPGVGEAPTDVPSRFFGYALSFRFDVYDSNIREGLVGTAWALNAVFNRDGLVPIQGGDPVRVEIAPGVDATPPAGVSKSKESRKAAPGG